MENQDQADVSGTQTLDHPRYQGRAEPDVDGIETETDDDVINAIPFHFIVDSAEAANWLIRKVFDARRYSASVKQWAEHEQRRAEREERTLMYLFGHQLREWAEGELIRRKSKSKSLPLPSGTVAFQKVGANLVVNDEGALLHWAKANCQQAVVVTERVSKTTLKDHFKTTGEQPDGTHVEPAAERMYIRPVKLRTLPAPEGEQEGQL